MMGMGMGAFDIYRDLLRAGFISHGGQREGTGYLRLLSNAFWMAFSLRADRLALNRQHCNNQKC